MLKNLIGRRWSRKQNCYNLIVDYYKDVVQLPDIPYAIHNAKFFLDTALANNFKQVYNIEPEDTIITKDPYVHLQIYIGNNKILHHPIKALSLVESISEEHINNIAYIVRRDK